MSTIRYTKKQNRKDNIELVVAQCDRLAGDVEESHRAWVRLRNELYAMSDAEARRPRFCHLLNAIWTAATNEQS